jgi:hypothetical protein
MSPVWASATARKKLTNEISTAADHLVEQRTSASCPWRDARRDADEGTMTDLVRADLVDTGADAGNPIRPSRQEQVPPVRLPRTQSASICHSGSSRDCQRRGPLCA